MKKALTFWVLLLTCTHLFSQNDWRIAKTKTPLSDIEKVTMPVQDNTALLEAELKRRGPGIAPKFAVNFEISISPKTHGTWERMLNGNALWRLRIFSKGAKSLNLGFTKYNMPRDGSLILYSPDQKNVMGPFTPADNEEHAQLWTPILDGEEMVIEVQVPHAHKDQLELELKYVNHDFVGFNQLVSGSCNLDVTCGGADGWGIVDQYRDIIQSVAVYSRSGVFLCTGFLVNNARQDCTPYFMTADHCTITSGNAASVVAYWNFENSTCRQPGSTASGNNGNGSLSDFNTGSIFRAGYAESDFTLLELDDPVSETANAFFAGWSAESFAPEDTVITIHHPNTEEKRISFEFDPTFRSDYLGATPQSNGNHITVEDWDIGTTETGSSGAPLFNKQKRVVGQLHGGFAACGNNELDSYGFFHTSWEGGGTPTTRLKDWLDPDNTGILVLDGRPATQCDFFVAATPTTVELCAPAEAQFTVTVSQNFASDVNLSVLGLPTNLTATFSNNPVVPGGGSVLTIGNTGMVANGSYTFLVQGTDGIESNFSNLTLDVTLDVPSTPVLSTPPNAALNVSLTPTLVWEDLPDVSFDIQISTDVDFNNIVFASTGFSGNELKITTSLDEAEKYYWRVKASNICGAGEWSSVYSFITATIGCTPYVSVDVPIAIPETGSPIISSTLAVTTFGEIEDVNVEDILIDHTWVSDLRIELTSPKGTTIELMNNVSGGDCEEDNVMIAFDDQAANPYSVLDNMCNSTPPALSGLFQPSEALSAFAGEEANGTWTLTVFDDVSQDGGALQNWGLEICTIVPVDYTVGSSMEVVNSCTGGEVSFSIELGAGFDDANGVTLTANGLPAGATATFDPNPAQPGEQVSVTLSDAPNVGSYSIEIVADDGTVTNSAQVEWLVNGQPSNALLVNPAQNAIDVEVSPTLVWESVTGATNYILELATDADFTDIIYDVNQPLTVISLPVTLENLTAYYWRVTAFNDCGGTTSAPFSFTTEKFNATLEVDGLQLEIMPNPTSGLLQVISSKPLEENVEIDVFSINGIRLLGKRIDQGNQQMTIDLTGHPAGIYLLRLSTERAISTERIILQ